MQPCKRRQRAGGGGGKPAGAHQAYRIASGLQLEASICRRSGHCSLGARSMSVAGGLWTISWPAALAGLEQLLQSGALMNGSVVECMQFQRLNVPPSNHRRTRQKLVRCEMPTFRAHSIWAVFVRRSCDACYLLVPP